MDPALPTQPLDNSDVKPSFRKRAQDTTNRKYRRHSPIGGSESSSSGGSPKRRSRSPIYSNDRHRKDDRREFERDSNHNRSSRDTAHKPSDKSLYGTSHDYSKDGDYSRHHRHAYEEDKGYHRSSRSGRESRSGPNSDYTRHDVISDRSREISRGGDKYSREKSDYRSAGQRSRVSDKAREVQDERRDRRRSPDGYKNDSRSYREEPKVHGKISTLGSEIGSIRLKDSIDEPKDKRKHDDKESDRRKEEKNAREAEAEVKSKGSQEQSALKKLKNYDSEDEKLSSSSKQVKDSAENFTYGPINAAGNQSETAQDLNAAKVAAMKAAELVNKNLVGTSYLSTDQKKKLLWGNKKNTSTEEQQPGNRWDLQLFADRERQEKFNKLMGVKGDTVPERKPTEMDAEMKQKLEMDLEKQYTAGLRRRDGRTVGLGL